MNIAQRIIASFKTFYAPPAQPTLQEEIAQDLEDVERTLLATRLEKALASHTIDYLEEARQILLAESEVLEDSSGVKFEGTDQVICKLDEIENAFRKTIG